MFKVQPQPIRVVVSHPLPLIAAGVVQALSSAPGIEACSLEGGGSLHDHDHDIVITDPNTALGLAARVTEGAARRSRSKLAVIADEGREKEVREALAAGVQGYLLFRCSSAEIVNCVRALSSGSRYLSEAAMRCIADSLAHEKLTPRESSVLTLLSEGLGNKAIAQRLYISHGTVKSHVVAILAKLGVANRTQAVTVATQRGLVSQHRPAPPSGQRDAWTEASHRVPELQQG